MEKAKLILNLFAGKEIEFGRILLSPFLSCNKSALNATKNGCIFVAHPEILSDLCITGNVILSTGIQTKMLNRNL